MNQLLSTMEKKGITTVRLIITDITGNPKSMIIPRKSFEYARSGIGIDGSSIPGFTTVDKSDLIAVPDVESAVFSQNEVILFCDIYETKNKIPFKGDPRYILKNIVGKNTFLVKPELEFFLLDGDDKTPIDSNGYMDEGTGLTIIKDVISSLDIAVERIHHENGPGQYEIELVMTPALKACDTIILLKEQLKKHAAKYGVICTFMPKPLFHEAGSGMHFHILWEEQGKNTGKNKFEDLNETAQYFIGGLLTHARGITSVCNPIINSYKRLVPNYEAPVIIAWGKGNRSTLVRIPGSGKTRIEFRSPDCSCNPYLALACIIAAGLDGVTKKIKPPPEVTENIFETGSNAQALPLTLEEALLELENDPLIKNVLGEHVLNKFVSIKKAEISKYTTHISQWELDHYLNV
ncbi:MAG: glutamine synthetase family protein [Candidatus Methanofastidiosia archaeon]|jgi:glutamine synthetase